MPVPTDYQPTIGTVPVTFAQNGTLSSVAEMGGLALCGMFSPNWPTNAGSITFRGAWDPAGTGFPLETEANVPYRVAGFGSGTFAIFQPGSVIAGAPYIRVFLGTAGTPTAAAGGTMWLVGRSL